MGIKKIKKDLTFLAFDTSTDTLSLALACGNRLIQEWGSVSQTRHSETLTQSLRDFLKRCRRSLSDVDVIAVGTGPGSFTGLRVGVTVAKILSYSLQKKLVGVTAFESLAQGAPIAEGVVAMSLDARKSMVYAAIYKKSVEKGLTARLKPCLLSPGQFKEKSRKADCVISDTALPKAKEIAAIAHQRVQNGLCVSPFALEPLYIHERDCNVHAR